MGLEITSIPQGVRAVEIDGHGMTELLGLMAASEPRDITMLAAVRYMFHKRLWDNQQPLAKEVLNRSYGPLGENPSMSAEEYRDLTGVAILTDYGYEMPAFEAYVPPPRVERDFKPKGKVKRQAVERHDTRDGVHHVTDLTEGESGSRTFKSLADHDVDTTGASDRLKKVIGIQRGD
jgi:hypothetical protein